MTYEEAVPVPEWAKFVFGGSSAMMTTCLVHPMDLIKSRIHLRKKWMERISSLEVMRSVVRHGGITALYDGLSAGLLRQSIYSTLRLGVYSSLSDQYELTHGKKPEFVADLYFAMSAGAVAALAGSPTEILLVRMTGDRGLPLEKQRKYKNILDGMTRISREEGPSGLFRGCGTTMTRAMIVNGAQLVSYSQSKNFLMSTQHFGDTVVCQVLSSLIAGLITAVVSKPVDYAKSKLQSMRTNDGKPEYRGAIDVMQKLVRDEGVLALWKGLMPYYYRVGPGTVFTFMLMEQSYKAYDNFQSEYCLKNHSLGY